MFSVQAFQMSALLAFTKHETSETSEKNLIFSYIRCFPQLETRLFYTPLKDFKKDVYARKLNSNFTAIYEHYSHGKLEVHVESQ